jgi:hypothetical protein
MANKPSVLLPVKNGALNTCHAEGVKFVCVNLALDFADLISLNPAPSCVLRGAYYINLPQRTVQLTNGTGNAYKYNLPTFLGAANLRTLSAAEVKCDILDETRQDGPFDLLKPAFNLTSCQLDSSVVHGNLKTLVVKLASDTIHE